MPLFGRLWSTKLKNINFAPDNPFFAISEEKELQNLPQDQEHQTAHT